MLFPVFTFGRRRKYGHELLVLIYQKGRFKVSEFEGFKETGIAVMRTTIKI
jgi:FAD synthase